MTTKINQFDALAYIEAYIKAKCSGSYYDEVDNVGRQGL